MIYGAETWKLTVRLFHKFKVTHSAMEMAMLCSTIPLLKARIRYEKIKQRTNVIDMMSKPSGLALLAAEPITGKRFSEWSSRLGKRSVGHLQTRWRDDLLKIA